MPTNSLQSSPVAPSPFIKEGLRRVPGQDPLDAILSPFYEESYSARDLQAAVAPLSNIRVTVSRFYFNERVVVDFQPADKHRHWNPEAKRRWCHSKKVAYVPVYLTERTLTVEQFKERLAAEREAVAPVNRGTANVPVNDETPPVPPTVDPTAPPTMGQVTALVTRPESLTGLQNVAEVRLSKLPNYKGNSRKTKLERLSAEAVSELQKALFEQDIPATAESVDAWIAARIL